MNKELRPYQDEALQHKHKQAHSELMACAWLLRHGYEVFQNVSQYGQADVVAFKNGQMLRIDVKTDNPNSHGYRRRAMPPQGVCFIYVTPEGVCRWWDGENLTESPPNGNTGASK